MAQLREVVQHIEESVTVPACDAEGFSGYAVMGLTFQSGHVLSLRRWPATSIGPGYTSVWHRTPEGSWTMYADAPPALSCARYFSTAMDRTIQAPNRTGVGGGPDVPRTDRRYRWLRLEGNRRHDAGHADAERDVIDDAGAAVAPGLVPRADGPHGRTNTRCRTSAAARPCAERPIIRREPTPHVDGARERGEPRRRGLRGDGSLAGAGAPRRLLAPTARRGGGGRCVPRKLRRRAARVAGVHALGQRRTRVSVRRRVRCSSFAAFSL